MSLKGLIIAAPQSNSGKTFITLSLLRALKKNGTRVASAKVGPDYIDPPFHSLAGSSTCLNLDGWAMRDESLSFLFDRLNQEADFILCEGAMGLFDGANALNEKDGSAADLARRTGWPVILVVDAAHQSRSVCALIKGFKDFDKDVQIGGVIFNKVGSPTHRDILKKACEKDLPDLPLLGFVERRKDLVLTSRHLGLVQAEEIAQIDQFLEFSANHITQTIDLNKLLGIAKENGFNANLNKPSPLIDPLGQKIAIARDAAFSFIYPGLLDHWQKKGATVSFFSPLKDQGPDHDADAIYLPGGYPELHAETLSKQETFRADMQKAAHSKKFIFGECGGYMALGKTLTNKQGQTFDMLGLLNLETSFEKPKLHLGYRQSTLLEDCALGPKGSKFRGHEFHYTRILYEKGNSLFEFEKSDGENLGSNGLIDGNIAASFLHIIDRA